MKLLRCESETVFVSCADREIGVSFLLTLTIHTLSSQTRASYLFTQSQRVVMGLVLSMESKARLPTNT